MNFALNIEKSCRLYPDKICVVQEDIRLTFNQMEERANRLAKALVEIGLKPGDRVAIFQTNCFQFCEMLYAVGKVAGILINLNFRFRGEEAAYILNNCTPKVLILGGRYTELIKDIRPNLPSIEHYIVIGEHHTSDFLGYEALLSRQSEAPFPCLSVRGGWPITKNPPWLNLSLLCRKMPCKRF
jgi:long-chain acyl-CoA synthetase